jgi:hypothetical protein
MNIRATRKDYWTLEDEKISLRDRIRGRHYHWVKPTWICNERQCINAAPHSVGKCDLCIERLAALNGVWQNRR